MKEKINKPIDSIIIKEIVTDFIPSSSKVDSRTFSRLLDDDKVVASYKMYWMLGILEEVSEGKEEIEFKRIVARMIKNAWYPIRQYRLNFGMSDVLKRPIDYIAKKYNYKANCDERNLLEFIYSCEDKDLEKMMKDLTNHVPYRLISPFFANELKGKKENVKNRMITEMSMNSDSCLYKIIKGNNDKISLNKGWSEYLNNNYKVIKSWIYYKLVCFLQKRNPNVPAVAFKLEAPKSRDMAKATKLWKVIIENKGIKDIYTGREFNESTYGELGVLSIDHFIPWSFVLHDEMWNLVPTFKNINSKKNDNLLCFDEYINSFCDVQYNAFSYICEKRIESALEEYLDILKVDSPYEYYKAETRVDFEGKIRQSISPLYQIAVNQGFQVVGKLV